MDALSRVPLVIVFLVGAACSTPGGESAGATDATASGVTGGDASSQSATITSTGGASGSSGATTTGAGASDTGASASDTGTTGEGATSYECVAVGEGYSDGFFALREFNGRLYAGQFGYGHENMSMLYRYAPWELTRPGLTGISESICALREWQGQLYANTESSADIARSADGLHWEVVFDGPDHSIGCGLEVHEGLLYAAQYDNLDQEDGRILRTANGTDWEVVWDSGPDPWYLRELATHDGALHAFAVDESTGQGYRLSSETGLDWSVHTTPSRFFRARSWRGALWIGSTERGSNGVAGIWRFDGARAELVHPGPRRYVTELTPWAGALWAGTSDGWKEDHGSSVLLRSEDGASWETVCEFPEVATWSIAVADGRLFAGTWEYGVGGTVYEVRETTESTPEETDSDSTGDEGDCAAIPASNPAWELCEAGSGACAGVYSDGAGCQAFCAAAGMVCVARFGGEPGCQKEPESPIPCEEDNGHASDWCECAPS